VNSQAGHLITQAAESLRASGVDSPQLDAEVMLARVLGRIRLDVITHPEIELSEAQERAFRAMAEKRSQRYPLAYLLGYREFYGLRIEVEEGVLVPRQETEVLVEEVVRRVGRRPVRIADVGVGSGAIAVALAVALPEAHIVGAEISPAALQVARRNVANHHLTDRVTLVEGDLLEPLQGQFDAVVSNPPYIPSDDIAGLQPEVAKWEPREALDGGPDGLDVIRRLLPGARELLKPDGFVALEIGIGQANGVSRIAGSAGYSRVDVANDLAGIQRVVVCRI
jgi:release factor glutamine methyltransferase